MDKTSLLKIFSKAFDDASWLEVLKAVFGAKLGLLAQPKPIILNKEDKVYGAYELGSFTTTDDRIIGFYKIEVKPEVWLERNKVGLRELLRNVYKYDVDGAIIVFTQQDKWRLSFVSEIKVLNDEGEIVEQATEPKRYTYLLGEGEKVRTPAERLSKLSGKPLTLQDILEAFSVEVLNEEFYKIIQEYFYKLVGGKVGKGKKMKDYGEGILKLPSVPKQNRQVYQEFAVRLIGRTVFCWFLKMKKSDEGIPLLPEGLLSSKAVKQYGNYYHTVLERVFFQMLNTPIEQRVDNLPEGSEQIPFLNGGLFEPGIDDYYKPNKINGLLENLNTPVIENQWFEEFFAELEKYNFTIDENSVTDVEVSVDPEMLGRIFENLLAEIDPDSGETARKATGSFYTPREIVDYMATESLVQYLHNKTQLPQEQLRPIFKMTDNKEFNFADTEREAILDALDKVKVLDPACGSGAFPMGVLQKIVQALQKLDPEATWWIERQVNHNTHPSARKAVREKLQQNPEYARKIGVIQNSLYGVDIQPVAAEISKLRCFLTLIVDENISDNALNRGIEPLPNLEFKFVTANTLIKLPTERDYGGLFNANDDLAELETIRAEYLQSFGEQKIRLKEKFKQIQNKIIKQQISLGQKVDVNSRVYKLSTWNPFSHEKADWFDPKWMFGVEKFDVVIGNPPYVNIEKINNSTKEYIFKKYKTCSGRTDLYIAFIENGLSLLKSNIGVLSFIVPFPYTKQKYGTSSRELLINKYAIIEILDTSNYFVFEKAVVKNITLFVSNSNPADLTRIKIIKSQKEFVTNRFQEFEVNQKDFLSLKDSRLETKDISNILKLKSKIWKDAIQLSDICLIAYGARLNHKRKNLKKENYIHDVYKSGLKPFTEGKCIDRYVFTQFGWLDYKPDEHYNPMFKELFESEKIMFINVVKDRLRFVYDKNKFYNSHTVINCVKWNLLKDTNHLTVKRNISDLKIKNASEVNYFYLLSILNSKLINWYFLNFLSESLHFYPEDAKSLPIVLSTVDVQIPFINLANSISIILGNNITNQINPHVPNSHIAQLFEEVVDAMVMELYFKEDFEKAGIEFIKFAERDFESIEGKSEKEQIEIIHRAYQKLREKDNEIRNNLKLMDIKLADIVLPIKSA